MKQKRNVKIERKTQTLATITIQNYFRLYDKLCGMTGTAETESEELGSIYGLDVTVIPTHRKIARDDKEDYVYKTKEKSIMQYLKKYQMLITKVNLFWSGQFL